MEGELVKKDLPELADVNESAKPETDEGRHMLLLKKALDKTVSKGLSYGRLSVFARSYSVLFERHPKAVKAIHAQFVKQLQENISNELATLYEEEDIVALCNNLDKMIEAAPQHISEPAWRPSGDVDDDVRDHVIPIKMAHKDRLRAYLTELEKDSVTLQDKLVKSKRKLTDIQKTIHEKSARLNEATKVCDTKFVQEISAFIKETDS